MPSEQGVDVTIVVTTKNRPRLLERALASVLTSPNPRLEVVVVDDGSDQPPALPDDTRVRLLRHELSTGANQARNDGLAAAQGRWVSFLDDDDELIVDGLGRALQVLGEHGDDVAVLGTVLTIDERTGATHRHVPISVERGSDWLRVPRFSGHHAHNSLVVSTARLRELGGFNPTIRSWTHDELFLRLVNEVALVAIDDEMYVMYENPDRSSVRKLYLARAEGILTTLHVHDALHGSDATVSADLNAAAAWHFAMGGDWHRARQHFSVALLARPTRRRTWARIVYSIGGDRAYEASRKVIARVPALATNRPPAAHGNRDRHRQV